MLIEYERTPIERPYGVVSTFGFRDVSNSDLCDNIWAEVKVCPKFTCADIHKCGDDCVCEDTITDECDCLCPRKPCLFDVRVDVCRNGRKLAEGRNVTGAQAAESLKQEAAAELASLEEKAVVEALWGSDPDKLDCALPDVAVVNEDCPDAPSIVAGIAMLEEALFKAGACGGYILIPHTAAYYAHAALMERDGGLYTLGGIRVVVDVGAGLSYNGPSGPAEEGSTWMYAFEDLALLRGELFTQSTATTLDPVNQLYKAKAKRSYGFVFLGCTDPIAIQAKFCCHC